MKYFILSFMLAAAGLAVSMASAVNPNASDSASEANAAVQGMGANCCLKDVTDGELTRNRAQEARFVEWATDSTIPGTPPSFGTTDAVN